MAALRQVIVRDRGRPARSTPHARSLSEVAFNPFSRALCSFAGGTPAVPDNHLTLGLEGHSPCKLKRAWTTGTKHSAGCSDRLTKTR